VCALWIGWRTEHQQTAGFASGEILAVALSKPPRSIEQEPGSAILAQFQRQPGYEIWRQRDGLSLKCAGPERFEVHQRSKQSPNVRNKISIDRPDHLFRFRRHAAAANNSRRSICKGRMREGGRNAQ
jgi:hypothetical protein